MTPPATIEAVVCDRCSGRGWVECGTDPEWCPACGGIGEWERGDECERVHDMSAIHDLERCEKLANTLRGMSLDPRLAAMCEYLRESADWLDSLNAEAVAVEEDDRCKQCGKRCPNATCPACQEKNAGAPNA